MTDPWGFTTAYGAFYLKRGHWSGSEIDFLFNLFIITFFFLFFNQSNYPLCHFIYFIWLLCFSVGWTHYVSHMQCNWELDAGSWYPAARPGDINLSNDQMHTGLLHRDLLGWGLEQSWTECNDGATGHQIGYTCMLIRKPPFPQYTTAQNQTRSNYHKEWVTS